MTMFAESSDSTQSNRARVWLEALRTGLWPIPLGMALIALLLYAAMMALDRSAIDAVAVSAWHLHGGTGDDARNLLSTLAAAIITMSSIVFSMTVVALSLAANQFGSRLVRTHMADLRTKGALGLFAMTIVYCLLALRSVGKDMTAAEVPHLTVSVGLLLALVCVVMLLFFLHFVARSVIADEVVRRSAHELEENVAHLPALQNTSERAQHASLIPNEPDERAATVRSRTQGYIEAIAYERLVAICSKHDVCVRMELRAGAFVTRGAWLAFVYPVEALTSELDSAIQDQILIGEQRTATQDIEFTLRHIVDIALRALSPGINDANTALVVIDHLSGPLSRLMGKRLPPPTYEDERGVVRIVAKTTDYAGVLAAALHQIRQAGARQPAVIIAMLRALGRMAEHVRLAEQRDALVHQADLIAAAGMREAQEPADRADIERAFEFVHEKLSMSDARAGRGPTAAYPANSSKRLTHTSQ